MKTTAVAALIIGILAIASAFWASRGVVVAEKQIAEGMGRAEGGVAGKDWSATAAGVNAIHDAYKNLYIANGIEKIAVIVAALFSCGSLICLLPANDRRPIQISQTSRLRRCVSDCGRCFSSQMHTK
mgnify:FL=1